MNLREAAQQATPREQLLKELMDSRVPKTEREHAAVREIERLRAALAEDAMQRFTNEQQMIERGTKAWAGVPDATAWVEEMRGNVPAPTCQESRQVEPVAWMCSDESLCRSGYARFSRVCEGAWNIPVYTAPPQRTPLTNQEIMREYAALWRFLQSEDHVLAQDILKFARAIERAHGIGGGE